MVLYMGCFLCWF